MRRSILLMTLLAVGGASILAVDAPLLFAMFDIGSAQSLPWGATDNFIGISDDYDVHRVVADTQALLIAETPTIVRMETLRRAAVYASRDRRVAEQLVAFVTGRIASVPRPGYQDALAIFDAGYVIEVLKELEEFAPGSKVFWRFDRAIVGLTRPYDSRALLEQSATMRPHDGAMQLAAALVLPATEAEPYLSRARASAVGDALLANNLARLRLQ